MQFSTIEQYIDACQTHYESYFATSGKKVLWREGPIEKLHPYFYVLEFRPSASNNYWAYCTVGMSLGRPEESAIELFVLSPYQTDSIAELLLLCASFHRTSAPLDLGHTVNIGRSWLPDSVCDHAFISLPYLHGEKLELLIVSEHTTHCYWLIPISRAEREYKISQGAEALEQLFEEKNLDYLNPMRRSLV